MHQHPYVASTQYKSSGAEAFSPHPFEPRQTTISQKSIPKVLIKPEAYSDMLAIAQLSGSDEIGWLGSVRILAEYEFLIEQIFLINQTVHGATTEMTEDGLADLFTDLARENPELCSSILFWGHVHPSNSTDASSQDNDQMKLFSHNEWFLRGIFGRGGRAEFSLFDYKRGVVWHDIPWQIYTPVDAQRQEYWQAQVAEKVSREVFIQTVPNYQYQQAVIKSLSSGPAPGQPMYRWHRKGQESPVYTRRKGRHVFHEGNSEGQEEALTEGDLVPAEDSNGNFSPPAEFDIVREWDGIWASLE